MINKAKVLGQQDDLETAIATLEEAEPHVDAEREPLGRTEARRRMVSVEGRRSRWASTTTVSHSRGLAVALRIDPNHI